MKSLSNRLTLGLLTFMLGIAGCGGPDYPETAEVTGKITLDGQPVTDAIVTFMPADGERSATGETDSNGSYTLTTYEFGDGAVPGTHNVAIYPKTPPPMPGDVAGPTGSNGASGKAYQAPYPAKYGLPKESGLTAEVSPDGENNFDFDMKSDD